MQIIKLYLVFNLTYNVSMIKVSIIGAGNVGATTAFLIGVNKLANVSLVDINANLAAGKALDIAESLAALKINQEVEGGSDYTLTEKSDVVVITSGSPRKPGMSRSDLEAVNGKIVENVCKKLKQATPNSIFIIVTNPVEEMAEIAYQTLSAKSGRVFGLSGVLDSARYLYFLKRRLKIFGIEGMVVGKHNENMIPLVSQTKIEGRSVEGLLDQKSLDAIIQKTKTGGAQIVNLLGTSAYFAPATSIYRMVRAVLTNSKEVLPIVTLAEGEYGIKNKFIGLPAVIGKNGIEKIIELKISDKELKELRRS
jgi:malate dehydrogenase